MSKEAVKLDSIGIIPAKGHSERIPRKNMALLAGKPLLQYTIEAALGSGVLDVVMVSTDDPQIGAFARKLGADVPFLRDARLTSDDTTMAEVLLDAVQWYETNRRRTFDRLCMLLPSSPLRGAADVVGAKRILNRNPEADSVLSVTRCPYPPGWALHLAENGTVQPSWPEYIARKRQELPDWCYENGAVFWAWMASFARIRSQYGGTQVPYFMPPERGLDVDHPAELAYAEHLLDRARVGAGEY
ncbi:MAG: acylneuraminate cytidylyltransferase family protein [bacterium]|nr:acylneuraminate cytidylyltransferase family protein [bacterium]